jgi:hypothetical protein
MAQRQPLYYQNVYGPPTFVSEVAACAPNQIVQLPEGNVTSVVFGNRYPIHMPGYPPPGN